MKRPLIVLAAGFVLGEVLALQNHEAVFLGPLWWLLAASVALGMWIHGVPYGNLSGNMQGRSAGKKALLLFLVLVLLGGMAGFGRGRWERERLDKEEALAGEFQGNRLKVRGQIGTIERGGGTLTMVLEDALAVTGNRVAEFGRLIVYMDEGTDVETGRQDGAGTDGGVKRKDGVGAWGGEKGRDGERGKLLPGMVIELRGKLEPVEGPRNPGEFDFRVYYRSKGTACRMFGEKLKVAEGDFVPYRTFLMQLKSRCGEILDTICLPEDSAIFKAVLLGDTSGMGPEVRAMYQRHGISHLLAVSGQHLAIIGGGIYLLMRRIGLGFGKAGVMSAVLVIGYGILTGSSGSAVRAVIMILCLWLAAKEGRSYDTLSALGLAALILLWKSPYMLYQSGFQLSFGAVLSIGGLGNWLKSGFAVEKKWQATILISLCVQIVLTPVVLFHYYQHPLYGIFLNLLVIPLISVLMYSGLLGIVLGSFWLHGGMAAVGAGHYVLCIYEWLCRQVERLPGYCLVMGRPSWLQIVMYGAGLAAGLYGLVRWRKQGREAAPWLPLVMTACLYGLCFLILFPCPSNSLEVIVMDVGQGDGIVMRTAGSTVLVDGGSSSDKSLGTRTMEPCLKSKGITVIDFAVVSHGDSDHISGLLYLLEESRDIKVRNLVLPGPGKGQEVYGRLEQAAESTGGVVHYMSPGEIIQAGALRLTCLYAGGNNQRAEDRNAHSLAVCADYGEFHMLFTGDMGIEQEQGLMELALRDGSLQQEHLNHVQVLKTAHHGSGTSSAAEFLDRLGLRLAVISYGKGNSYGHPSQEVVERMKNRQIPVMETGIGGAVMLWTDGRELVCRYFK